MATYTISPSGDVVLVLTQGEAKGLRAFADEGAEGLLACKNSARGWIGGPAAVKAARRAIDALSAACAAAKQPKDTP